MGKPDGYSYTYNEEGKVPAANPSLGLWNVLLMAVITNETAIY